MAQASLLLACVVHAAGEAGPFYRQWPAPTLIGMESTGNCQWLIDLLTELGHEVWIGEAAQIRATMVRQQKTDRRDAAHLLELLVEGRFPRIWVPSSGERDQRQLLIHRYKLVTLRARVKNELQHLALNQGMQKKRKLWSEAGQKLLRELPLKPWASRRREGCATIPGFAKSICIAVTERPREWPRWQRHASWPYDCTGCYAPTPRIQKSFVSRAARGCPWSAEARPKN